MSEERGRGHHYIRGEISSIFVLGALGNEQGIRTREWRRGGLAVEPVFGGIVDLE